LIAFIAAGHYVKLAHDPAVRPPLGPHGGGVRVFYEPKLLDSLRMGGSNHPKGAAAVAEVYALDRKRRTGWVASVKTSNEEGGFGWFWLEARDQSGPKLLDGGQGLGACTGCHAAGDDYVLGAGL
jgi:hypothetical protein